MINLCLPSAGTARATSLRGLFWSGAELLKLVGLSGESMRVVAGMCHRMNLASPGIREMLSTLIPELLERGATDPPAWSEWVDVSKESLDVSREVFLVVSTGEV